MVRIAGAALMTPAGIFFAGCRLDVAGTRLIMQSPKTHLL